MKADKLKFQRLDTKKSEVQEDRDERKKTEFFGSKDFVYDDGQ